LDNSQKKASCTAHPSFVTGLQILPKIDAFDCLTSLEVPVLLIFNKYILVVLFEKQILIIIIIII